MDQNEHTLSGSRATLRPEARPFTYVSLIESQREAFNKIIALLTEALEQLELSRREAGEYRKFPQRLRPQTRRFNPVIMISGRRGTGKTSLLLALQREVIQAPEFAARPGADPGLTALSQRIVWLETLDLEPLPQDTTLMAAIMARIEKAVDEDCTPGEHATRHSQEKYDRVIRALNELSLDVCLAWDRKSLRSGNADIDLHARELRRLEQSRTSLMPRFMKLLEDLAAEAPWSLGKRDPLFVLPVDDIDLNPSRCLELLRLVRSFVTPRLVVLIMGDIQIVRSVVNASYLKDFRDLGLGRE